MSGGLRHSQEYSIYKPAVVIIMLVEDLPAASIARRMIYRPYCAGIYR